MYSQLKINRYLIRNIPIPINFTSKKRIYTQVQQIIFRWSPLRIFSILNSHEVVYFVFLSSFLPLQETIYHVSDDPSQSTWHSKISFYLSSFGEEASTINNAFVSEKNREHSSSSATRVYKFWSLFSLVLPFTLKNSGLYNTSDLCDSAQ